MSEYGAALDFLAKQENGTEHVEAIKSYIKAITDESKQHKAKYKDVEAKLKRFTEVAGEEDLETTINSLKSQVTTLTQERDTLKQTSETVNTELQTLKDEKTKLERGAHFRTAAEKIGANYAAFDNLFGSFEVDSIVIDGDSVSIKEGDKTTKFDEYINAQDAWKKSALFGVKEGKQPANNPLPSASSKGGTGEPVSVGDGYISARYGRRFESK